MKSQIIPIFFVILVASLILTGFLFYNLFYGTRTEEEIFKVKTLDAARNLIENLKNYLKSSLIYSSIQAIRENARSGGAIGAGPWICNGANPLPAEKSKECLEKYTKYYLSIYGSKFNTTLPLKTSLKDFSSLIYDVDTSKIFDGKYDEGNFFVNASNAQLSVFSESLSISENFDISEYVTKNRYWYMFRIFTEFANEDPLSSCICSNIECACSSSSSEESCSSCLAASEACGEYALKILQSKFDNYVKCEKENICCQQGIGPPCLPPSDCLSWSNRCSKNCEHECIEPQAAQAAQKYESYSSSQTFPLKKLYFQDQVKEEDCNALYWKEARFSSAFIFTCKDYKYYVSSPKGPQPLTFSITAYVFLRDQDACKTIVPCNCTLEDGSKAKKCEECKPLGNACTECKYIP